VEGEEIADYVSLQLESLAPFPIEHLQYGYATDREGNSVFVYAAYRRRFEMGVVSEWAKMEVVVPDFVVALLSEERSSRELCLVTEESVSIVKYDSNSRLPVSIRSLPRDQDEDGELVEPSETLEANGARLEALTRIWNADAVAKVDGQTCFITTARNSDGAGREFTISREDLWWLDIRDRDTIAANQAEERKNTIFWKAIIGAAACLVFLLLGELFYGGFGLFSSYKREIVVERQPLVNDINDKNSITKNLEDFQDATLAPFVMLNYTKVESLDSLTLEVTAFAPSQALVNQFKARIERAQSIQNVEIKTSQNQTSGTRFTAILTFKPELLQTSATIESEGVANG